MCNEKDSCPEIREVKGYTAVISDIVKKYSKIMSSLILILVLVLILWFSTIIGFIWYINQYDYVGETYAQDGNGVNNYNSSIGGDINNGTDNQKINCN